VVGHGDQGLVVAVVDLHQALESGPREPGLAVEEAPVAGAVGQALEHPGQPLLVGRAQAADHDLPARAQPDPVVHGGPLVSPGRHDFK
jgi:hypothetical protein